jgi:hypothetical protein
MSGEAPSVLWIHESTPKYTHRIEMNIGQFIAWLPCDYATDCTNEGNHVSTYCCVNPLNAELNPICHLLALLGGATIVGVSRLRVNTMFSPAKP